MGKDATKRPLGTSKLPRNPTREVFINCPFDHEYHSLFNAIVFTVIHCGFEARCALEESDSAQVRIQKIMDIIRQCRLGIHDISRTELDKTHQLPRFNMPLELGIFLGARYLGTPEQKLKRCLILDRDANRYQKFCSDISGQDIASHDGSTHKAINRVRDWLQASSHTDGRVPTPFLPGGEYIRNRYEIFERELPKGCANLKISPEELTFIDRKRVIEAWLKTNPTG